MNALSLRALAPTDADALATITGPQAPGGEPWPDPLPLGDTGAGEPYPDDALPPLLADAVEEVRAFVQAPLALVAGSALASLSLAAQALADVERMPGLSGPASLYMLTVAESGERKSSCDAYFARASMEWEREQAEAAAPGLAFARAAVVEWEAKHAGTREAMKAAAKGGSKAKQANLRDADALRAEIEQLEANKPTLPRVPRLRHMDVTPESLAYELATRWPSAAVMANEAGMVLGSHAMSETSIMRNLSLLNTLWEGGEAPIGRRSTDCFTVRGARLTIGLQSQGATLRAFLDKSGPLARDMGFLARFLIAWPDSTQGTRWVREAPTDWPALGRFNARIRALLDTPAPIGEDGALTPTMLSLIPAAKAVWTDYANDVERELRAGGECNDVRDVASKSADNAARLAALFHVLEHGPAGAISVDHMRRGCILAAWHLGESRRLLADLSPPKRFADAVQLDQWLIQRASSNETIYVGKLLQYGPNMIRNAAMRDAALGVLAAANRVRVLEGGVIAVNPALLA